MSQILVPLYFGQISYWSVLLHQHSFNSHPQMPFQKSSRLNRTAIMTANGIEILTVPVQGGRNTKIPYSEVLISYDNDWQKNHWNAIQSAYGKSAYWEYYHDKFKTLYQQPFKKLIDLNITSLELIASLLKVAITAEEDKAIIASKDVSSFLFYTHSDLPIYFQTFSHKHPFASDLSILDLVFNTGPKALLYLKNIDLK